MNNSELNEESNLIYNTLKVSRVNLIMCEDMYTRTIVFKNIFK